MNIRLINLILILGYTTFSFGLIAEKKKKAEQNSRPTTAWIFDCKEKRECVKKCVDMRVLQGHWGGDEYENTIRTECVRSCQERIICTKDDL